MKSHDITRNVALGAMLAAAVALATMIHVPMPGMRIYFNLGEGVIYVIAILLGARYGALSGGIGAALADILLGYPLWAPLTLLIKGTEGAVVGILAPKGRKTAILAGALVMIVGYTTSAGFLYGWKVAPVELVTDFVQTGIGGAFALLFAPLMEKRLSALKGNRF
ncbi:MAG: ECF transporter S component [Thermovirgaceae bacterium]